MNRPAENAVAKVFPIGPRINEMEMPDLVHHLRRSQVRWRHAEEIDEPLVFIDRRQCLFACPAVFAGKTRREWEFRFRIVDIERFNTLPKIGVGGHGVAPSMSVEQETDGSKARRPPRYISMMQ